MWRWSEELAAGPADVFLATLEDIWLEREPQNVPGTFGDEAPNWRRRMSSTWPRSPRPARAARCSRPSPPPAAAESIGDYSTSGSGQP
jgi:hypothetical protein